MIYKRSPINYTGSKYKLLDVLLPIFPKEIDTFVDLFGGSGTMTLNVDANHKIYNELNRFIYEIINEFKNTNPEFIIYRINQKVEEFELKKGYGHKNLNEEEIAENIKLKENFFKFREYLNNESNNKSIDLLNIHYFAFNNLIRHTKRQPIRFNTPSGVGSKTYSPNIHNSLIINACNIFKEVDINNKDFREVDLSTLKEKDFVYLDPPYLLSVAEYNKEWNEEIEKELYKLCDYLTSKNVKWALSNMIHNKGIEHTLLIDWYTLKGYKVHYIDTNYIGWISTRKEDYKKTQEVLITNY